MTGPRVWFADYAIGVSWSNYITGYNFGEAYDQNQRTRTFSIVVKRGEDAVWGNYYQEYKLWESITLEAQ